MKPATAPRRADRDEPDGDEFGPQQSTFWQRYNKRFEFPTSIVISVFMMTVAFGFIVLVVVAAMMGGQDKTSVPIRLVEGGFDDEGEGSAGSGGTNNPLALAAAQSAPQKQDYEALPTPKDLPKVLQDIKQSVVYDDPNATTPISDEKAASYAALDEALRNKMLNVGQNRGAGPNDGKGDTGQTGTGPGGVGSSSTRARSLRWILRFSTRSGRDYLDQLKSLGAVVLVPIPPENKQMYIFRDLNNPKPGTVVTEAEWNQLSQQIQFCDFKRDSVIAVSEALSLNFTATQFWAFFPKGLEDELARLEIAYRNRRPEDVEETVFVVSVRNGKYELVVAEQRIKK